MKPHLKSVNGQLVIAERQPQRESAIDAARRRFGQQFAHEPHSSWKPRSTPLLTAWLQTRGRG